MAALASTVTSAGEHLDTRPRRLGRSEGSRPPLPLSSARRLVRFAAVGGSGTLVNLVVVAALTQIGVHYLPAAIIAAEVSILSNFCLQERFVFADRRDGSGWRRLGRTVAYNNVDAVARLPFLALLVEAVALSAVLAQALTLAAAFLLRFLFLSRVVYRAPALVEVG